MSCKQGCGSKIGWCSSLLGTTKHTGTSHLEYKSAFFKGTVLSWAVTCVQDGVPGEGAISTQCSEVVLAPFSLNKRSEVLCHSEHDPCHQQGSREGEGVGNGLDTTREDLSRALMHAFCSTQYFEPFVIPLLLDKLSFSLPLAKIDSLKYLDNCIRFYGADRMVRHASAIWYKLKEVIFNLSSDQLLISEALNCVKTAIMYTDSSDKDLFINLVLFDEDIVNKIHSVSSVEKSILSSSE